MILDSHCHLDFPLLSKNLNQLFMQCHQLGISYFLIPSVNQDNWQKVVDLTSEFSSPLPVPLQSSLVSPSVDDYKQAIQLFFALGIHPLFMPSSVTDVDSKLIELAQMISSYESVNKKKRLIALGEMGLDYFDQIKTQADVQVLQRYCFQAQIALAKAYKLPLILHVRTAHQAVLKLLKSESFHYGGVVHSYSGSLEEAKEYLKLNFKLGIGCSLTFDRTRRLRSIVQSLPLSSFLLETDAPDQTIEKTKKKIFYEKHHLPYSDHGAPYELEAVILELAQLKSLDFLQSEVKDQFIKTLHYNALSVFPRLKEFDLV